ncbi:hypothetical protein [Nocardia sp. NPDC052112]
MLAAFATDMNLADTDFFEIRHDVAEDGMLRKQLGAWHRRSTSAKAHR